ncbi:MAG: tetratricopeptide repeat protein, partial [Myxococcota bacterium]
PDRRRRPIPRQSSALGSPQGREWLVRHPDGRMVAFRELTTLQKWIVEGRINRDDEISKNGETWKRLGNISELEPFFSVYEKAQTLNQMVEHGAPIAPISVRGTDVLASVHPIAPSSNIGYAPLTSAGPTSSLEHHPVAGPVQPMLPPPIPPATQPAIPVVPAASAQPVSRPALPLSRPVPAFGSLADVRPAEERASFGTSQSPNLSSGFLGPAAINTQHTPAAFGTSSLDLPAQLVNSSDPVADFKNNQRRQRWGFIVALLLFLGVGIGAGFIVYGPKTHPIRVWAAKNGIWPPKPATVDLSRQIEAARTALERDTDESRAEALELLAQLHARRPTDPSAGPWRAFAAAITAQSQRRWISDIQAGEDPDAEQTIDAKRARAARLVTQAADWLRPAQATAPDSREVLLAQAAIALAQGKPNLAQRALSKVATSDAKHRADPLWLHLSAAAVAARPDPGREALRQAQNRLHTALAARPSMVRAYVLLARLLHRRNDVDEARRLLQKVVELEPTHEESLRLLTAWSPSPKRIQRQPKPKPVPKTKTRVRKASFESLVRRADLLRERDRATAALAIYEQAEKMRPNELAPRIGKGWCLLDLGEANDALVVFQAVQRQAPNLAEAHYGLAETHREMGNKKKALDAYQAYLARTRADNPERRAVMRQIDILKK